MASYSQYFSSKPFCISMNKEKISYRTYAYTTWHFFGPKITLKLCSSKFKKKMLILWQHICQRKIFPVLSLLYKIGSNRLRETFHSSNDNYSTNLIIQQNAFLSRVIAWGLKTECFSEMRNWQDNCVRGIVKRALLWNFLFSKGYSYIELVFIIKASKFAKFTYEKFSKM